MSIGENGRQAYVVVCAKRFEYALVVSAVTDHGARDSVAVYLYALEDPYVLRQVPSAKKTYLGQPNNPVDTVDEVMPF